MHFDLRQPIIEMERYAKLRPFKSLQRRCCDHFAAWLKTPESGIRITGTQGFISKTHADHLRNEIFYYEDPTYVGVHKNEFLVAYQFVPFYPGRPLKIAEFKFCFNVVVTHQFKTAHGKAYLQRMWSSKTDRHFYMVYKSHFFDRYALRVFENETDRTKSLAYFSAQMAKDTIVDEHENSKTLLYFADGVGLGRRFKVGEEDVVFMNTFVTHEMHKTNERLITMLEKGLEFKR